MGDDALLVAERGDERVEVHLQRSLLKVAGGTSAYTSVQRSHGFGPASPLRPDLLLRHSVGDAVRWVVLEVKGGKDGSDGAVERYARAALRDLLTYREDARDLFERSAEPYGLGVAWGEQLSPVLDGAVALCTPDTLGDAIEALFADARGSAAPSR